MTRCTFGHGTLDQREQWRSIRSGLRINGVVAQVAFRVTAFFCTRCGERIGREEIEIPEDPTTPWTSVESRN
jgi:hypothetical protein